MIDMSLILPSVSEETLRADRAASAPASMSAPTRKRGLAHHLAKRWSMWRIAKRIGITPQYLTELVMKHDDLRALLDVPRTRAVSGPGSGALVTDDDVEKAGRLIFERHLSLWAPSLNLKACVQCGTDQRRHITQGLCWKCHQRRQQSGRFANLDAWDRVRGNTACVVCQTTTRKHHSNGRCQPCHLWMRTKKHLDAVALDAEINQRRRRRCDS